MKKMPFLIIISLILFACSDNKEKKSILNLDLNPQKIEKIQNHFEGNLTCIDTKSENLKIAKFAKLIKKAEEGDKRLIYLMHQYLELVFRQNEYQNLEYKLAEAGDISSQHMFINIADEKNKSKLIKQWYFEDYMEVEKYIINPKSLPMPQNILDEIIKKANHNNLVAMYILQEYYLTIDKKKYIFWLKKLANSGDISAQHSLIFDAPKWERWKLAKKYHLELDYFMSFHLELLNKGIIEYRDDDPKGVFFDENGSVIKYE